MSRPQIRHIALFAEDPEKLLAFYVNVFKMDFIHRSPSGACYVSDGYLNLAILPHALVKGTDIDPGVHHFGFQVDDTSAIGDELVAAGAKRPWSKTPEIPFAEFNAADIEGNPLDLSVNGWRIVRHDKTDEKTKEPV